VEGYEPAQDGGTTIGPLNDNAAMSGGGKACMASYLLPRPENSTPEDHRKVTIRDGVGQILNDGCRKTFSQTTYQQELGHKGSSRPSRSSGQVEQARNCMDVWVMAGMELRPRVGHLVAAALAS
jgi:hypothetical protein